MTTIRISADIKDDRQVVLTLPPEVPVGKTDLIVTIASGPQHGPQSPPSSLADWAEEYAEHWGSRLSAADVAGFTGRGD